MSEAGSAALLNTVSRGRSERLLAWECLALGLLDLDLRDLCPAPRGLLDLGLRDLWRGLLDLDLLRLWCRCLCLELPDLDLLLLLCLYPELRCLCLEALAGDLDRDLLALRLRLCLAGEADRDLLARLCLEGLRSSCLHLNLSACPSQRCVRCCVCRTMPELAVCVVLHLGSDLWESVSAAWWLTL